MVLHRARRYSREDSHPCSHSLRTRLRAEVVASVCCEDTSLRGDLKMSLSICSPFGSLLALYSQGTLLCLSRKTKGRTSYLLSTWLMPLKIFPSCKCLIVLLRKKPCAWRVQQSIADNPNITNEQLGQSSGPLKIVCPRVFSARLLACSRLHRPTESASTTSISVSTCPLLRHCITQKRWHGRRSGATTQLQASTS